MRKICRYIGCNALTNETYCDRHRRPKKTRVDPEAHRRYDAGRRSSHARGYDRRWYKFRAAYLARHPWCDRCGGPATEIHHVKPLRLSTELKYEEDNLVALCKPCHTRVEHHKRRNSHLNGRDGELGANPCQDSAEDRESC